MTTRRHCLALALVAGLAASAPPLAAEAAGKAPEKDRQSILAMAGDYRVRFDMRETVPFVADYKPLEPKKSGGHEVATTSQPASRASAAASRRVNQRRWVLSRWPHSV